MCVAGGVFAIYKEGTSALENGADLVSKGGLDVRDPKGEVWWYIGTVLWVSVSVWIVWAAVGMWVSRLFRAEWEGEWWEWREWAGGWHGRGREKSHAGGEEV